jgi:hypothetical protein
MWSFLKEMADFEVKGLLPNLTRTTPPSFAGNVGVNRPDHPNATLFFWAFEKAKGSLTSTSSNTDPWIIWLNGELESKHRLVILTGLQVDLAPPACWDSWLRSIFF